MKKLWSRISLAFILLLLCVSLVVGLFLSKMMKDTYIDLTRSHLLQNSQLFVQSIDSKDLQENPEHLQSMMQRYDAPNMPRMTIIHRDGQVLADSEHQPVQMEDHSDRPEVRAVLLEGESQGESIRWSETLGLDMMYVTIPFTLENENTPFAVVRSAVTLDSIDNAMKNMWINLAIIMGVALMIAGLVSMRIAKGITSPIEKITKVARQLAKKDYSSRITIKPKGEMGQLSSAINVLARSLERQMHEIQESQQQLKSVLTNMVSGVMHIHHSGQIKLVNPAMVNILNTRQEKLLGKDYKEIADRFGLTQMIERCMQDGQNIHEEIHIFEPDERILDTHLAPFVSEEGEIKGIIIVLHDITDIRRFDKMRSEFVANVSHELKTPVTSVKGFAETLLDGAIYDEEVSRTFLKIIYDESVRLHRLINDILHLSKIEQHMLPLNIEQFDLIKLVDDI